MKFFRIGRKQKTGSTEVERQIIHEMAQTAAHKVEPLREDCVAPSERLAQANARVADLEARLESARRSVADHENMLKAAQDAAVEAATRGGEPGSLTGIEVGLRSARDREHIFEEALERAKTLLQAAEAEANHAAELEQEERRKAALLEQEEKRKAALLEQDKKFILTLKELMGHAAKMAEWHEQLRQLQTDADDRYPSNVLWPAFNERDHYAQWLSTADALVHRFQPGKDVPDTLEAVIAEPAKDSSEGARKAIELFTLQASLTTRAA